MKISRLQRCFAQWKIQQTNFESNFVGVNRLFALVYSNLLEDSKLTGITYQKEVLINITLLSMEKNSYDQPIDSDIKRFEEIRKLTTGQVEDYNTGCLLDYDYIKNPYRLIAADLSRQKE